MILSRRRECSGSRPGVSNEVQIKIFYPNEAVDEAIAIYSKLLCHNGWAAASTGRAHKPSGPVRCSKQAPLAFRKPGVRTASAVEDKGIFAVFATRKVQLHQPLASSLRAEIIIFEIASASKQTIFRTDTVLSRHSCCLRQTDPVASPRRVPGFCTKYFSIFLRTQLFAVCPRA